MAHITSELIENPSLLLFSEIESKCFGIASPGAGLNYACAPFGASVMQYIKHPSEFVVVTYRACGRLEILSHFLNAAQEKLDAVSRLFELKLS